MLRLMSMKPRAAWMLLVILAAGVTACTEADGTSAAKAPSLNRASVVASPPQDEVLTACKAGRGFGMADEASRGQAASPLEAPALLLRHDGVAGFSFPRTGWTVVSSTHGSAVLRQGSLQLNALRGRDGTWHVDSGWVCR